MTKIGFVRVMGIFCIGVWFVSSFCYPHTQDTFFSSLPESSGRHLRCVVFSALIAFNLCIYANQLFMYMCMLACSLANLIAHCLVQVYEWKDCLVMFSLEKLMQVHAVK